MRYFTSDLHVGDKTIAQWRGFASVEEHDALLLAGLALLQADDELWILGDVCKPNVAAARALREAIPCERVHIVIGNHDTGSKFVTCGTYASVDYYAQVGKVAVEGYKFVMSHYPMLDWDRAYHGSYMLHGHIHSLSPESSRSCSWDSWAWAPTATRQSPPSRSWHSFPTTLPGVRCTASRPSDTGRPVRNPAACGRVMRYRGTNQEKGPTMAHSLELYYYPECPFCQRVLRAIDANGYEGIVLKNIHADAEADATLVRVGGKHQVPCLFIDGEPLYESLDIIDWLARELG